MGSRRRSDSGHPVRYQRMYSHLSAEHHLRYVRIHLHSNGQWLPQQLDHLLLTGRRTVGKGWKGAVGAPPAVPPALTGALREAPGGEALAR